MANLKLPSPKLYSDIATVSLPRLSSLDLLAPNIYPTIATHRVQYTTTIRLTWAVIISKRTVIFPTTDGSVAPSSSYTPVFEVGTVAFLLAFR